MADTSIEWAEKVWNPTVGCEKVSQGCKNCYAERMAKRLAAMGNLDYQEVVTPSYHRWNGHVRCLPERLDEPLKWKKPKRVFVDSMSDLFHPEVPDEFIMKVWGTMYGADRHTFIILTKRPRRMCEWVSKLTAECDAMNQKAGETIIDSPLFNVWLGVSVEDQKTADERIPWLLQTPAAVRLVSVEPMLEAVDLRNIKPAEYQHRQIDSLHGVTIYENSINGAAFNDRPKLDWVICGGESGPNARPMHPDWVRSLGDQCVSANTPFFFKQWGEWAATNLDNIIENKPNRHDGKNYAHFSWPGWKEQWMARVGKKRAGNILDGQVWDQYPKEVE